MSAVESWLWAVTIGILLFLAGLGVDSIMERAERRREGRCRYCDEGDGW